jgi:hypothetical protein
MADFTAAPVVQLATFSETFTLAAKTTPSEDKFNGLISVSLVSSPDESGDGTISLPSGITVTDASDGSDIKVTISGAYGPNLSTGVDEIVVGSFNANQALVTRSYTDYDEALNSDYDKVTNINFYTWSTKTYTYTVQYQLWDPEMPPPAGDFLDPVNVTIEQLVAPNYDGNVAKARALVDNQSGN